MTVSNTSAAQSQAQEAMETLAQTKAESAKGDQQAIRKLASGQAAQAAQTAPQPSQQPTAVVDSDGGHLDAKA